MFIGETVLIVCRRRAAGSYHSSTGLSSLRSLQTPAADDSLMDYLRHLEGLQVKLGNGLFIHSKNSW